MLPIRTWTEVKCMCARARNALDCDCGLGQCIIDLMQQQQQQQQRNVSSEAEALLPIAIKHGVTAAQRYARCGSNFTLIYCSK